MGAPSRQLDLAAVAGGCQFHLRAFGQFANNVVQRVRRRGRGTGLANIRRRRFDDFDIHIGRVERDLTFGRVDPHVRQNGDGVAPLHHTLHMPKGFKERRALNDQFHGPRIGLLPAPSRAGGGSKSPK